MKKHYETHVEDTDKLISVAGPELDYKSWYEQYRKLMEEQAQRKYGLYTPTSEGDDDDFPSITGMIARYSALGLTNEQMATNPVWVDKTGNGHDLQMKNFAWKEGSGISDVYPGALVFDGVDDFGVCENFPILTKEKGYTVVALRQWITRGEIAQGLVSNVKNWLKDGAFLLEYRNIQADHLNKPKNQSNMKFIIIPKELFDSIPEEAKKQLGIDNPRMNIDETEVLLHIEHYDVLFPPMMTLEEDDNSDIVYPFPTYDATSTEFNSLITSDEWSTNTKDYDI